MEEEKKKVHELITKAWQISKPIFDAADDDAPWEKASKNLKKESEGLEDPERELLQNATFAIWDYINVKVYEKLNKDRKI